MWLNIHSNHVQRETGYTRERVSFYSSRLQNTTRHNSSCSHTRPSYTWTSVTSTELWHRTCTCSDIWWHKRELAGAFPYAYCCVVVYVIILKVTHPVVLQGGCVCLTLKVRNVEFHIICFVVFCNFTNTCILPFCMSQSFFKPVNYKWPESLI